MQWLPAAEPGDVIACARCGAHLRRLTRDGISRVLPLTLAAAVTFMVMITAPIIAIRAGGRSNAASIGDAVVALYSQGMAPVAVLLALTTLAFPLLDLTLLAWIVVALLRRSQSHRVGAAVRVMQALRRWGMVEVFMLGVLVSIVKVAALAEIVPGVGLWALAAYLVLVATTHASFDGWDYWARIGRCG